MRNTLTPLHSDVWVAQWLAVLNILLYYLHDTIFEMFRLTQVWLTVALQYYKIIVFDATMYCTACIYMTVLNITLVGIAKVQWSLLHCELTSCCTAGCWWRGLRNSADTAEWLCLAMAAAKSGGSVPGYSCLLNLENVKKTVWACQACKLGHCLFSIHGRIYQSICWPALLLPV